MNNQSLSKVFISLCSTTCFALGSLVIIGWLIEREDLIQVLPSFVPMQFNTALGFCIFGLSTLSILTGRNSAASVLSILGGLLGLLTLTEYAFNIDLGIDELFMEAYITVKTSNPGRMAPNTALCFFLSGITSYLLTRSIRQIQLAGLLSTVIFTLGIVAFEGYLVNIESTYGWANFTRMAIHTAFGFIVLSIGIVSLSWLKVRNHKLSSNEKVEPWIIGYTISLFLALFVVDIGLPLGLSTGTLYIPLVLFGWYLKNTRNILILTVVATGFTWLGFMFSPEGSDSWMVISNRSISSLAIWIIGVQLYQHKRKKIALAASEELLQAEERFERVVENSPNAIVLINQNDSITMVNKQTEILFGYNREELVGQNQSLLIPKSLGSVTQYKKNRNFDSDANEKLAITRKDGAAVQVEIAVNNFESNTDRTSIVTIKDVTNQKLQEETIKKQMTELEQKNHELEQLTYIASHDLQEPLRTVSNYVQVIEEDFNDQMTSSILHYFDRIKKAIERMQVLVRTVLDFSRLGQNKELIETNCSSIVEEVLIDLDSLIKETGTIISVDNLPQIFTYKTDFRQLFQNLIVNAIKFRSVNTPCQIHISCEEIQDHWKFSIRDNGIGIDTANLERIFSIFQQLHREGKYEGNGIGLANCKKIAQLHGGDVWAESELNQGSIFYFTIAKLGTP